MRDASELSVFLVRRWFSRGTHMVSKTNNTEEDREEEEAAQLDWLSSNSINKGDGSPVTRNGTGADENEISDCRIVENQVDVAGHFISWQIAIQLWKTHLPPV